MNAAWGMRQEMLAKWDTSTLQYQDLFAPFLPTINAEFQAAVYGVLTDLQVIEDEKTSKTPQARVKPITLFLSHTTQTVADIEEFADIQSAIKQGTKETFEIPVEAGKDTKILHATTRPGAIPFVITSKPLTKDEIARYNDFFGGAEHNFLLPEVDFEIGDIIEYEAPDRSRWESRYNEKRDKMTEKMAKLIDEMHELREFREGIAAVLRSRRAIVDVAVKKRVFAAPSSSTSAILDDILDDIANELNRLSLSPLSSKEQADLERTLAEWGDGTAPKDVKKRVQKIIALSSGDEDGVAARAYLEAHKERLHELLRVPVITWARQIGNAAKSIAVQNAAAKRRANQLYDIIHRDLAHRGGKLRSEARQKAYCTKRLECLERDAKTEQAGKKIPFKIPQEMTGPWNQDRATRRKAFKDSLAYLESQDWFSSYIWAGRFPNEVCLDKGLFEKVKGGATISSLQLLPPRYPSRNVHANVFLVGPANVMRKTPQFVVFFLEGGKGRDDTLVLCIDINRLNCPRTFAFRLRRITPLGSTHVPLDRDVNDPNSQGETLSLDDWAKLANVYDFKKKCVHAYVGRRKGGGTRDVNIGQDFFTKVCRGAFPPDGTARPRPSRDRPYDLEAIKEPLDFSDTLGTLMAYFGSNHAHKERHKVACIRKLRKVQRALEKMKDDHQTALKELKDDHEALKKVKTDQAKAVARQRGKSLRLLSEIYYLNLRTTNIRKADLDFLARATFYMITRFKVGHVAHEALHISSEGIGDGLGPVVKSMVKDFSPIEQHINRLVQLENFTLPSFDATDAHFTSQHCLPCHAKGIACTMDRVASPDWAVGTACGRVDDTHGNAAENTGDRVIRRLIRKEEKERESTEKEEGEGDEDSPEKQSETGEKGGDE